MKSLFFRLHCKIASLILKTAATTIVITSTAFGNEAGYAVAHDGSNIYYEVHGTGHKFLLVGFQLRPSDPSVHKFVDGLGDDYRLILVEYPAEASEAKMYTLTPTAVARDYLAVAKAAGADEFAFYGYSWGAVCGLQLALRTDRMKALIAGGFPMINGPYSEIRKTLRATVFDNAASPLAPEYARQLLTYYEGLKSFDDHVIQSRLKIPRLNFLGAQDRVTYAGGIDIDFFRIFNESSNELKAAGWDVITMPDKDHMTALAPEVVIPLVKKWLHDNWSD